MNYRRQLSDCSRYLPIAIVATLVTGCANQHEQPPFDELNELTAHEWVLEDINNQGIIDNSRVTLNFGDEGRVAGRASCNRYFAVYSVDGETLNIQQAATTMMACPEALMNQERRFLDALQGVHSFEIDATGALVLTGENSRILAR